MLVLSDHDVVDSPGWWLLRLGRRLADRQKLLKEWRAWYSGDHPLPQGPRGAAEAYRDFQKKARSNFMESCVTADVHRLLVVGVADGQGKSDTDAWGWWQRNRLDSRQLQVYRTALSCSAAYVMVGQHPKRASRPLITPEHPREVIVEDDPATGERAAALKAWWDDRAKQGRANVYLPDRVIKFRTSAGRRSASSALPWSKESWEQFDEQPHGLPGVPVVEFAAPHDLGEDPVPTFAKVIDIQARINLGVLNRMTAGRYSAFRQKYVTNHEFPRKLEVDPETGLEVEVVDREAARSQFLPDPGSVWASEGDARFGEFSATDLSSYLKEFEGDVRTLFVLASIPAYYLPGDLINVSSDTVIALDTNHLAKVGEEQAFFSECWEDVLQLAAAVAGDDVDRSASEVRWRDPRQLNPSVVADRATKLKGIGWPLAMIAEDMGESPQRVDRLRTEAAAEQMLGSAFPTGDAAASVGGQPGATGLRGQLGLGTADAEGPQFDQDDLDWGLYDGPAQPAPAATAVA